MLVEFDEGLGAASGAPKEKLVIVAAGSELLIVKRPLKPTYFLSVAN